MDLLTYLKIYFMSLVQSDYLSPYAQFVRMGYSASLLDGIDIQRDETVLVLGGYLGDSATRISKLFSCGVVVYEPVPEYASVIDSLDLVHVEVRPRAVTSDGRNIDMQVLGDASSMCTSEAASIQSDAVTDVLNERSYALLEVNIEGGEYEVLEAALSSSATIPRILIVQFHNVGSDSEYRRSAIRRRLAESMKCDIDLPFVWERWVAK